MNFAEENAGVSWIRFDKDLNGLVFSNRIAQPRGETGMALKDFGGGH